MSKQQLAVRFAGVMVTLVLLGAPFAGSANAHTKKQAKAAQQPLLKMLQKNPTVIRSRAFTRKANHANLRLQLNIRLNRCLTATAPSGNCSTYRASDDELSLDLGPTFGTKTGYVYGSLKAVGIFKNSTATGTSGSIDLQVPTATGLVASPVNVMHNSAVNGSTVAQFGCSNVTGGSADAPTRNQTGTDANSPNTLLRTARISLDTAPSNGTANLFSPDGSDLTLTLSAVPKIWTVLRIMKELGDPHTASATATVTAAGTTQITADGEQCRQVYAGYTVSSAINLDVSGTLKLSPSVTRDEKIRVAIATLTSTVSHVAVKACLHSFAWYSNLASSTTTTTTVASTPDVAATKANSPCNSQAQPTPSLGPVADPIDSDGNGTASPTSEGFVELAADASLSSLTAEILVGYGTELGASPPITSVVPQ